MSCAAFLCSSSFLALRQTDLRAHLYRGIYRLACPRIDSADVNDLRLFNVGNRGELKHHHHEQAEDDPLQKASVIHDKTRHLLAIVEAITWHSPNIILS